MVQRLCEGGIQSIQSGGITSGQHMDELEPSAQAAVDGLRPCAGVIGPSQHLLAHSGDEGELGVKAA